MSQETMNTCELCKKMFGEKERSKLNRHKKLRHDCPCPHCNSMFVDDMELKTHLRDNHGVRVSRYTSDYAYECRKCLQISPTFGSNIKHEQLDHLHECEICIEKEVAYPFSFIDKNGLKRHKVKMHKGEMEEAISQKSKEDASLKREDSEDDDVVIVAVIPKLIKEQKFHHVKIECPPIDSSDESLRLYLDESLSEEEIKEDSPNIEIEASNSQDLYESCFLDKNSNKLTEAAIDKIVEQPTIDDVQSKQENKLNRMVTISKYSVADPYEREVSPLGFQGDMYTPTLAPQDYFDPHPQSVVCGREIFPLMDGFWNQNLILINQNPPEKIGPPGRGRARVRGGFQKGRGQRKRDEDQHMSGLKVIIPDSSRELQQQQHSVPTNIPKAGDDGEAPFSDYQSNHVQLVNPSYLMTSSPVAQAVGTPMGTPPTHMVRAPPKSPITGSLIAGTSGTEVRLTYPVGKGSSPMMTMSPITQSMGARPMSPAREVSPPRGAPAARMIGLPMRALLRGRGEVRMRGTPGEPLMRGMRPRMPGTPGGPRTGMNSMMRGVSRGPSPRIPMGLGAPGTRGSPGGMRMRTSPGGVGMPVNHGGMRMRGSPGGMRMRGSPGGPHVMGMRPRMPMQGARLMGVQGAPRQSWSGGPKLAVPPVLRADPASLPPSPNSKKVKVDVVEISDDSDESSPPTPEPANSALDRLKLCGITVTRPKATTIPEGLKMSSTIAISHHFESRDSHINEAAGGSAIAPVPVTQAPSAKTLNLDTLTPEQMHQLKLLGII